MRYLSAARTLRHWTPQQSAAGISLHDSSSAVAGTPQTAGSVVSQLTAMQR